MGDEIYKIKAKKGRLWIEILNKSYKEDLKIKKNVVSLVFTLLSQKI